MKIGFRTVNSAMKSTHADKSKEAEITLALLHILFTSPNARERNLSTRAKRTARFRKFWRGDFISLVEVIPTTSSVQAFHSAL